ncbi:hypothetical protein QOZ80_1BG0079330 [Eleusine coracana subsp. coracana]|nr:hypothetical protein QOZ80_1BG0079330 [Eleusine coracana subsp. coracana]
MVLMAAVENDRHRVAKHSPAPPPAPAPMPSSRTRLHGFSFPNLSWGTHRLLRCTKSGTASAPPSAGPETQSLDKEKPHRPEGGGGASLQRQRAAQRPWNLRTRRSATAAPPRPEGSDDADEGKKRGFFIALSKQEIAEDFAAIRGTRPPRRPKKRPRPVQRQLDLLYPGLCLADVTPASYKIEER